MNEYSEIFIDGIYAQIKSLEKSQKEIKILIRKNNQKLKHLRVALKLCASSEPMNLIHEINEIEGIVLELERLQERQERQIMGLYDELAVQKLYFLQQNINIYRTNHIERVKKNGTKKSPKT